PAPRMVGGVRQQSARPPSITNPPTGQISAILERQASGLPLPRAALGTPTGAAPRPAPISPPPARQAGSASPWAATPLPAAIKPGAAQVPIAQVMSEALSQVSRPHQVRWSLRSEALVPTELVARLAQVVAELIDSSTAKNPSLVVLVTVNTAGSVLYVTVSDRAAAGPNGPFGLGHRSRAINAVAARMGATLAARAGPGGRGSDVTLALPLPAESLRPVTPLRQHPGQINPKPLVVAAARPSAAIGARPAASAPHTSSPRAPQTLQESGAAVAPPPAPPPAPRPGVPAGPQPVNPEDPWHTLRR
ncbi:MAG: hypothetical protein FWG16_07595, partial [Micrococcales bacterium]|nr:hypothetical protein [Micrococcales bacterium]